MFATVRAHFATHRARAKWPFFWRITAEGLVVSVLLISALSAIFDLPPSTAFDDLTPAALFVTVVIVAPFFETLVLQALPVLAARRFGLPFWGQVLASLVPFAAVHFPAGIAPGISGGVLGGFYFAFTYVHWRQTSFRSALWMTSGSHAAHNALIFLVAKLSGQI